MDKEHRYETTLPDGSVGMVPGEIPPTLAPRTATLSREGRDRIAVGASLRLWSLEGVSEDFGIEPDAARELVDTLALKLLKLPGTKKRYVNLYALESAMFMLTLPDSVFPIQDGKPDWGIARLHQELAGSMYMAASKEAIRERVKHLAKSMGKGLTLGVNKTTIKKREEVG